MKHLVGVLLLSPAAMAIGSVIAITSASGMAVSAAQISVGADTPIEGVTIGIMVVGLVAGVGIVYKGGKHLLILGGQIRVWRDGLDTAAQLAVTVNEIAQRLDRITERQDEHERWRAEVDPILTELQVRLGVGRRDLGQGGGGA